MIDPNQVTNFNRTSAELQEFILFCAVVAGKSAHQQAHKLNWFLDTGTGEPFEKIEQMDLMQRLKESKLGQYNRLHTVFTQIVFLDLEYCTVEQLEAIPGIGQKTSRFFVTHSRPNQNYAILDTHILAWMKSIGHQNIPKSTPQGKRYQEIEQLFLQEAKKRDMTPADLDLQIWKERSRRMEPREIVGIDMIEELFSTSQTV
jgi:thermostable 8-oxoguanine DNA glycosylase